MNKYFFKIWLMILYAKYKQKNDQSHRKNFGKSLNINHFIDSYACFQVTGHHHYIIYKVLWASFNLLNTIIIQSIAYQCLHFVIYWKWFFPTALNHKSLYIIITEANMSKTTELNNEHPLLSLCKVCKRTTKIQYFQAKLWKWLYIDVFKYSKCDRQSMEPDEKDK